MLQRRTDLAEEAREIWAESSENTGELSGVVATEEQKDHIHISRVEILDERGESALGKPKGTYITLTLQDSLEGDVLHKWVNALKTELQTLLSCVEEQSSVLVVGLGNPAVTPDAIGPKVQHLTAVTRHLVEALPEHFAHLRPVSALASGVLGTTGLESSEIIRGVTEEVKPSLVIAVDALASRSLERVCRTIQLADTGITPGSGVGNHRGRLDKDSLGVPVLAIGVPTVVDGATLVADLLGDETLSEHAKGKDFFVTPKEIDSQISKLSKLLALGINQALNPSLTLEDITLLTGDS